MLHISLHLKRSLLEDDELFNNVWKRKKKFQKQKIKKKIITKAEIFIHTKHQQDHQSYERLKVRRTDRSDVTWSAVIGQLVPPFNDEVTKAVRKPKPKPETVGRVW